MAQSAFGPHRVITDRWKGMSPEQVADVKRTQEMQKKEKEVCVALSRWTLQKTSINILSVASFDCCICY